MKIIAHCINHHYHLTKATQDRQWMDETPGRYAYRCLPLNIANQHGWHICSPVGFSAYWTGGMHKDCLVITPDDPNVTTDLLPDSTFGSGILTFPVPFIFRTPSGILMQTVGPINMPKDGIQPLSGIIETDWSPYSFTMNWKFTRPNQVVRFEAGEPFCQLFPLVLDLIEQAEPEQIPIASAKDVQDNFNAFSKSRDWFYAQPVDEVDSMGGWQKEYFRGLMPGGEKADVQKHRTKIRFKSFRVLDPADVQRRYAGKSSETAVLEVKDDQIADQHDSVDDDDKVAEPAE